MIDVDHLVTLSAIRRTGSIGGAASQLGFTPSAVSQQVRRLERRVGGPVLDRVGRGVMLTELGRHLVDEGADILTALEALEAGLGRVTGGPAVGTVRLVSFSTGVRGLVAPALRALGVAEPGLDVSVVEQDPHEAIDLVASGAADSALVHGWGDLPLPFPDHVEVSGLGTDAADVLVTTDHPLAAEADGPGVGAARLATERWVCAPAGSVCHGWLTHMFDLHGLRPDIRHEALEFASQVALVDEGVCVALVPRLGRAALPPGVVAVPVTDPRPTRRVMMTWRRSMAPSPAITRVRDELARVAAERLDP
ncbi:LysR family transcriptional regulator [Phycicoccus sp. CSK15P-2]|uniref:LysR family transcriptional regulator n=1 Tax=Phycicoccus sp. CSK15P-2 TaxID=2807627 RepID=UPI00194F94F8|nr:LysR family transcriptional regulator [Phycicoccus sp. CSK15P-2]MBM6405742.1 LysR family transcriptional regulator [Phycicoccus sp. CSK15P-2]